MAAMAVKWQKRKRKMNEAERETMWWSGFID
jgi:hypothetical protein